MADDKELIDIRNRRVQELEQMQRQQQKQEEINEQQKAALNSILNQALDQQARARLNTIMIAKPDKGKQLESVIIQMGASGQIAGKLGENELIALVERINAQTQKTTSVKFDRRRAALDSDED